MDREDLWRANHAANEARAAKAAAARKARAERCVPRVAAPVADGVPPGEVGGLPAVVPPVATRPALSDVIAETVARARAGAPRTRRLVRPWPPHLRQPRWKLRER